MLVKQDIQKKKQALQEEKSLISERLNARLQAENDAQKREELSELQRQLTLIAADPTRTKDYKELQNQIEQREKEIADQRAREEAQAAQERLDEESKAYDAYVAYQEQKLNEMLKDANSTALYEELNAVMGDDSMSREERIANYMDWIKANDDNYKYGTEAMRLQLEQNNVDSWNKMLGFVDTYWDQVEEIIGGGLDAVLEYMKGSSSYRWASETGQSLLEINWSNVYEAFEDAYKDTAEWDHTHELITDVVGELEDLNFGFTELNGIAKQWYDLYQTAIEYDFIRDTSIDPDADKIDFKDYAGVGKKQLVIGNKTYTVVTGAKEEKASSQGGSKKNGYYGGLTYIDENGVYHTVETKETYDTMRKAIKAAEKEFADTIAKNGGSVNSYASKNEDKKADNKTGGGTYTVKNDERTSGDAAAAAAAAAASAAAAAAAAAAQAAQQKGKKLTDKLLRQRYASGGLVDFTGPAWLDGTPSKPEYVLNADQTKYLMEMADSLSYVSVPTLPYMSINDLMSGETTVGDINIVINQADLSSDADIDDVARKIGRAFTREMSKEGLNLAGYNW